MKKPFRETALGKKIIATVPKAKEVIGDLLPSSGLLGIVKNLISDSSISPEEKRLLVKEANELEIEIFRLEQADKASARTREIEYTKATGHIDYLMAFVCVVIFSAFGFCSYVSVYELVPEAQRDAFLEIRTTVRDGIIIIIAYYFGATKKHYSK